MTDRISLTPSRQLKARYRASKRHKLYCGVAVLSTVAFLAFFFGTLIYQGYSAFVETEIRVKASYTPATFEDPRNAVPEAVVPLISRAWLQALPRHLENNPELMGKTKKVWITATARVDQFNKGNVKRLPADVHAPFARLQAQGRVQLAFNSGLFFEGDSRIPSHAGLWAAFVGSLYVMFVVFVVSFPVGVATAIYLEEFAPDNRFTQAIQVNINNLAAVPSIIYGLLGLAIFINFAGVPRSSALVGGLTLSLMTLPYIIISSRAALAAVPQSIRHGALAVGASRWQTVRDHVLPLSFPGILTGTIIGIAQAVGETAPLLLIGMIAFIPEAPTSLTDAATVLPAQIYSWATLPAQAYRSLTAAGILALLALVIALNATAIVLRNRFERRW